MGSWNKWRGPALRGEDAVYAAKACRNSIDSAHGRVRVKTSVIPPLFPFLKQPYEIPELLTRGKKRDDASLCSASSAPQAPAQIDEWKVITQMLA
jgi:hypothetical protein